MLACRATRGRHDLPYHRNRTSMALRPCQLAPPVPAAARPTLGPAPGPGSPSLTRHRLRCSEAHRSLAPVAGALNEGPVAPGAQHDRGPSSSHGTQRRLELEPMAKHLSPCSSAFSRARRGPPGARRRPPHAPPLGAESPSRAGSAPRGDTAAARKAERQRCPLRGSAAFAAGRALWELITSRIRAAHPPRKSSEKDA